MTERSLPPTVAGMIARNAVTDEDVALLRRTIYADGVVSADQAEWMFAIENAVSDTSPSWAMLFIEALTDYVVVQQVPEGHVDQSKASWLSERIMANGVVNTRTELELLIKVLERATTSPPELSALALAQVREAVLSGRGPVAAGVLKPGVVGAAEVDILRRVLYAFGGDGSVAITRAEAEILFDINDRTAEAENDPTWSDLFVKAVANFLMAASGYYVPCRQEALRREAFLDARGDGVSGFFGRMLQDGLRGVFAAYTSGGSRRMWEERNERFEAAAADAERLTAGEAEWLANRIGRDGLVHANEQALIDFLRAESPALDPAFDKLVRPAA